MPKSRLRSLGRLDMTSPEIVRYAHDRDAES
jgi:hypothetical protein